MSETPARRSEATHEELTTVTLDTLESVRAERDRLRAALTAAEGRLATEQGHWVEAGVLRQASVRILELQAELDRERGLRQQAEQERDSALLSWDQAVDEVWDEVLAAVQRAWNEPQSYGDCPTELIARVINERDEALAQRQQVEQAPLTTTDKEGKRD